MSPPEFGVPTPTHPSGCHILLTGFEPFTTGHGLTLDHNPTADIVENVGRSLPTVEFAVLPVSYEETPRALNRAIQEYRPRMWIGLGYAPHRTILDFEVFALNMAHATRGDNDGERPRLTEIIPGAPHAYRTRLDVKAAIDVLSAHGVPTQPSFHAGTFLCNQSFYLASHQVALGRLSLSAFVHVPPMKNYAPFEAGLTALLQTL